MQSRSCVRHRVERLEPRAMLSASFGKMSQDWGTDASDAYGVSPPRGTSGEFFALEQPWATGGDPSVDLSRPVIDAGRSQHLGGQIFSGSFPATTFAAIPVRSVDAGYAAWHFLSTMPPPPMQLLSLGSKAQTDGTRSPSLRHIDIRNLPPPFGKIPTQLTVIKLPLPTTPGTVAGHEQSPSPTATIPSWSQSLAVSVKAEGLPSSANAPTYTGPRALPIAAAAAAAAFDDYASHQLPIGTSNNLYPSHAHDIPRAKSLLSADEVREGFFPSDKMLPFDSESSSRMSLDQERAAIEEILGQLRDPGSLGGRLASKASESWVINSRSNSIMHHNGFFVPDDPSPMTGTDDEGMILLQAAGDANECEYNLAGLFESGFEISQIPLGLEASVGIHRAIDTALEDVVQSETKGSQVHADDWPRPRDTTRRAAGETERSSFHSAAATVAIAGWFGLVLLNRRNKPVSDVNKTGKWTLRRS